MAQYDEKTLAAYEIRLAALEAQCLTQEERDMNLFVIKIVRSVKMTLWLTNGAVKWMAAPIGVFWGIYAYGANVADAVAAWLTGLPR